MTYVKKPDPVDVCIVGAGATGGTTAKVLAEAGLKVVVLEKGPRMKPENFSGDELKYVNRNYLWPDPKISPRTVRADEQAEAKRFQFSPTPQMVGGGTVHWAGWVPRPLECDFKMHSLHGDIEGADLADWPITYDDLEPYLTKVEWEFGVSGLAEANKYEPRRSKGYPTPPLQPTRFGKKFYEGSKKLGINAFPIPHALITKPHKGRTPSNYTGFWNQYGDPGTTRSSTLTSFIPEALATGNCELRTGCHIREVTLNKDGRAKGVIYIDLEGREVEQEASVVVLCGGAIESTRLLLMSKSNLFPDGLANSSGLVGKYATFHEYAFATGLFDKELHDPLYGFAGHYISGGSMQFYETDEKRGHIGGCILAASQVGHPINWVFPDRPEWGMAMKDADRDFYNYSMKIGIILQDLPQESNRVDLDPNVTDAWGLPVARITYKPHSNDIRMANWMVDKNAEILEAAGASKTIKVVPENSLTGNTCHQHGTARMGNNPTKSVLNKWCQAHDVDNLYILDGSSFPTSLGVNPTLTMMANAWRCSEYIAGVHAKGREDQHSIGSK